MISYILGYTIIALTAAPLLVLSCIPNHRNKDDKYSNAVIFYCLIATLWPLIVLAYLYELYKGD